MSLFSIIAEILYVGHSLVGPTLPGMVETALRFRGVEARVEAQIINGSPLSYQWDHAPEAEGVDARARLAEGSTDILVLTEAIPLANQIAYEASGENVKRWYDLAIAANPDTQVYLYETWHNLLSGSGQEVPYDKHGHIPWRERLDEDLPLWRSIIAGANAARPDGAKPVRIIPAGQAMAGMADAIADGRVPGLTDIRDLFSDDIHLNDRGLYLVAMTHVAVLTGESPVGLPPRLVRNFESRKTAVNAALAEIMQQVAWEAVTAFDALPDAAAKTVPTAVTVATDDPARAPPGDDTAPPAAGIAPADDVPGIPRSPLPGVTHPSRGFNLAGLSDWSVEMPFIDLMKTARPWVGHLPNQWGGWGEAELRAGGYLENHGWLLGIPPELTGVSTLVLSDFPRDATGSAGRYRLSYAGQGKLRLEGRAKNVRWDEAGAWFDFSPGDGGVVLTVTELRPDDPIRDIRIIKETNLDRAAAGELFNPAFLRRMEGVRLLRFMDWMATNNAVLSGADERPRLDDYTWARNGVPAEIMVALANRLHADAWFTLPHLADDGLVRTYAEIARDGLAPGLKAYVEYSNEVWNWQFAQARWAEDQAQARWGTANGWVQFYALRAAEVAAIWRDTFGQDAPERLVRVVATQTGWPGLEEQILKAPLVVAEGRAAPVDAFDAYAVTGYFDGGLGGPEKADLVRGWMAASIRAASADGAAAGLAGTALSAYVTQHVYDHAIALAEKELRNGGVTGRAEGSLQHLLTDLLPYHQKIARDHGLKLVMYEGGTHVVGRDGLWDDTALTGFLTQLNYSPEMGGLYRDLLAGWAGLTDTPFVAFNSVMRPSKWGSWGALRHLDDDNPRWQALVECATC